MPVVEPRPPFFRALTIFSREQPLWALWLANLLALLFGAMVWDLTSHQPTDDFLRWYLIGFFTLTAIAVSGLIVLKQSAPKTAVS